MMMCRMPVSSFRRARMRITTAGDLMVPVEEYATVPEDSPLFEAVMALEHAQDSLDRDRYKYLHRAVLVYDKNNKIVGKMNQLDVLKALEPKYAKSVNAESISRSGLNISLDLLQSKLEEHGLWDKPLKELWGKAAKVKVKTFMYAPKNAAFQMMRSPI